MPRFLITLLLPTLLLTACGGGGGGGNTPATGPSTPGTTPVTPPPADTSDHFYSYASNGKKLYAIDRITRRASVVRTLATPTETPLWQSLPGHKLSLGGRTIRWSDTLYLDGGKIFLLSGKANGSTVPAARQLSSLAGISSLCPGSHIVNSADNLYYGLLLMQPDGLGNCTAANAKLITTNMTADTAPLLVPANWLNDISLTRLRSDESTETTGYIGIRSGNLVLMDNAHAITHTLKTGVSVISQNFYNDFSGITGTRFLFFNVDTGNGEQNLYLLDRNSNTLSTALGQDIDLAMGYTDGDGIYGLHRRGDGKSEVYLVKTDGSTATSIGCAPLDVSTDSRINLLLSNKTLVITDNQTLLVQNASSCIGSTLTTNLQNADLVIAAEKRVLFTTQEPATQELAVHDYDTSNGADTTTANALIFGIQGQLHEASASVSSLVRLTNFNSADVTAGLDVESDKPQGNQTRLLGTLDPGIVSLTGGFIDVTGFQYSLGVVVSQDKFSTRSSWLYSFDAGQSSSMSWVLRDTFITRIGY